MTDPFATMLATIPKTVLVAAEYIFASLVLKAAKLAVLALEASEATVVLDVRLCFRSSAPDRRARTPYCIS